MPVFDNSALLPPPHTPISDRYAPFKEYLINRTFDPKGLSPLETKTFENFVKLMEKDENFPDEGTFVDYVEYLESTRAPEAVKKALKLSFKRHATEKHSSVMASVVEDLMTAAKAVQGQNKM